MKLASKNREPERIDRREVWTELDQSRTDSKAAEIINKPFKTLADELATSRLWIQRQNHVVFYAVSNQRSQRPRISLANKRLRSDARISVVLSLWLHHGAPALAFSLCPADPQPAERKPMSSLKPLAHVGSVSESVAFGLHVVGELRPYRHRRHGHADPEPQDLLLAAVRGSCPGSQAQVVPWADLALARRSDSLPLRPCLYGWREPGRKKQSRHNIPPQRRPPVSTLVVDSSPVPAGGRLGGALWHQHSLKRCFRGEYRPFVPSGLIRRRDV